MQEYEFCWSWTYLEREAAGNPDPPVYQCATAYADRELLEEVRAGRINAGFQVAPSFSEWALAFTAMYLPFGMTNLVDKPNELKPEYYDRTLVEQQKVEFFSSLNEEQRAKIAATYPELGFMPWYDFGKYTLRGGPDVLLQVQEDDDEVQSSGDYDLGIAARTEEAFNAVVELLGLKRD